MQPWEGCNQVDSPQIYIQMACYVPIINTMEYFTYGDQREKR